MLVSAIIVLIFLLLSAVFSAAETSILNVSQAKINKLKNDGDKKAASLLKIIDDKEKLIGSLLLGNNFVNVGASAIATGVCIDLFGDGNSALIIATGIMTVLILIISEVLPKTYAVRHSEFVALALTPLVKSVTYVFTPFVRAVKFIVDSLLKLTDRQTTSINVSALESIKSTIEIHHEEGDVVSDYKYMLGGVIDLEKVTIEEVMVHRNEIYSVDMELATDEIIRLIIQSPNSRIPLWIEKPENIIGVLHVKDIYKVLISKKTVKKVSNKDIIKLAREPWFIPNTTNLKLQLFAFRQQHYPLALVVNEYGELEGLVTLEDIIEEVVGPIEDEYDVVQSGIFKVNRDGSVVVIGNTSIRDLNRELEWDIDDKDVTTVGGLLFHLAQGIPELGKKYKHNKYVIKLIKKKKNKILKVKIWQDLPQLEDDV